MITRASAGSVTTAWVLYVAVGLASGAAFTYVTSSHREAGYREALANIGRVMSSSLDMAGVIDHFAENLRTIIPFDQLAVSTVDTRQGITSPSYVAGANKTDSNDIGNPVPRCKVRWLASWFGSERVQPARSYTCPATWTP